ncbi:hypothetical protein ACNKHL_16260 [Shigella flexneri]
MDKDRQAVDAFMATHVRPDGAPPVRQAAAPELRVNEGYYDESVLNGYSRDFVITLFAARTPAVLVSRHSSGAVKFYTSYTLKTWTGQRYLEDFANESRWWR